MQAEKKLEFTDGAPVQGVGTGGGSTADVVRRVVTGRNAAYLVAAAVAVAWSFIGANFWVFTVTAGMITGIAALGLLVVVGWAREISLVQAGLTGTAAYLTGYFYRSTEGGWGAPYLVSVALAIAVVVALSLVLSLATAKLSGIYIMVLTLGLQFMIERTIFTSRELTGGISAFQTPRPELLGVDLQSDQAFFLFTLVVAAALIAALARLRRSAFGRALLFVGWDRKAAAATGVSPWRYKVFAFAVAGVCAGVAGALLAPLFRSPPLPLTFGAFTSLLYLSVPVVAGFESLLGVVGVAVLYSVVPQAFEELHISPFILAGVGLLVGTLAGPRGLTGAGRDLLDGLMRRRKDASADGVGSDGLVGLHGEERRQALDVLEAYIPQRAASEGSALVGTGISLAFGGVQALRDVDITIPSGKLTGLIGPNGAGKSTLLDVLNGLSVPDSGRIQSFAVELTGTPAWERAKAGVSRTFQANRIVPDLTVRENLLMGATKVIRASLVASIMGSRKARAEERRAEEAAWAVAVLLDLRPFWEERAGELDFGAQRRVEIGRTLLSGPRLLLLDEPAAGLDAEEARHLFELVQRLKDDLGLTVVLVEHYVKAVLEYADFIYVLNQGAVLAKGTPETVVADPDVRAAYLGDADYSSKRMGEHV